MFLEFGDGCRLWIFVRSGKEVDPEATPHCGRIDILLSAGNMEREAVLLSVVTKEIDEVGIYTCVHTYVRTCMYVYTRCCKSYAFYNGHICDSGWDFVPYGGNFQN